MNEPWDQLVDTLRNADYQRGVITASSPSHRIEFQPGLTNTEIQRVELEYQFQFPEDLRSFLQTALPTGEGFPDWRAGNPDRLREWLDIPRKGIVFDVETNDFWLPEWGTRPDSTKAAARVASRLVQSAPTLIPIYSHRMMPAEPTTAGNPVFSVHQTDIIYYGVDLTSYLCNEFKVPQPKDPPESPRDIRFWDIDRFQETRWAEEPQIFDNSNGLLP